MLARAYLDIGAFSWLLIRWSNLIEQMVSCSENTAEGVRSRSERRGKATRAGGVQPGHVQNRAL